MGYECSDRVKSELRSVRSEKCVPGRLRTLASEIVDSSLALLFPHFSTGRDVGEELGSLCLAMSEASRLAHGKDVAGEFVELLVGIRAQLLEDATAMDAGDPAAGSLDEVILAYPGFLAIAVYRVAHAIHGLGVPLLPRMLTECAHSRTGIDIHPGALIGRRFFIDHGTGVVIGETAVVGNGVKLYQGVTLGALTVDKQHAAKKRHPTLEDDVVVYANATILGGETVVGKGALIGGNVWLTQSVPPHAIVTHRPDIRVRAPGQHLPMDFQI